MKSLLVLRHAKSSWSNVYLADYERPLNARGQHDAPRVGQLLHQEELVPDLIITSSAERALRTAELVAINCDYPGRLMATRQFYHADPDIYFEVLRHVSEPNQRVMVVGHNPGMEELIEELTGEYVEMTTATLVHLQLDTPTWADFNDETPVKLLNVWRPKEL
jgi:phosphohistidine phosphatase